MRRDSEKTVLVIDNDPEQLKAISLLLRDSGYSVLTAHGESGGIELARQERPYLIVADASTAGASGIEVCRLIREHPELRATRVLLLVTNHKDSRTVIETLKAGADDYLEAPCDPALLLMKAARLVEGKRTEEALRESQARVAGIVNSAMDAIITVNSEQRIMLFNTAAEKMFRCAASEAIEQPLNRFIPARFRSAHSSHVLFFGETGVATRAMADARTVHGLRADGEEFPVEASISQIEAGGQKLYTVILRDITERKRSEEALVASEARFSIAFDASPISSIIATLDEGRYVAVNDTFLRWTGFRREEVIGRTAADLKIWPTSEARTEVVHLLKTQGSIRNRETRYRMKNGEERTFLMSADVIQLEGRPHLITASIDISERKQAEAEMARLNAQIESQRRRLDNIIARVPGVVFEAWGAPGTSAQRLDFVSNYAVTMLGYGIEEWLSTPNFWLSIIHPDDRERMTREAAAGFASALSKDTNEYRWVAKDGRAIWVESNIAIITDEGSQPIGVRGVAIDITKRKQLEEQFNQAQKMEAIGQLAGGIAHDFNNLLTVIAGYSDLAMQQAADASLRRYIEEIKNAGERATSLTRQLLAFSRKQILQPEVLNLNSVVSEIGKILQRLIGEDIELRMALDPEIGSVIADPGQIEQVIMNLSVNARDAMPHGGKLTIETRNVYLDEEYAKQHIEAIPGPYTMMAVSDTGTGMSAETQAHIFEPFYTTKGVGRGTGLGLSTVYGIIKQSDGNIWVYSEFGKGTTFKIYLPRVDEAAQLHKQSMEYEGGLQGSETILLTEDDEAVRNLASKVLKSHGYKVLEAADGSAALLVCQSHKGPIDLLLTDIVMPDMSGSELAKRFAKLRPGGKVVYMSGYTDDAIVNHGVLDSGLPFLQKPFTPNDLLRKVREVLDVC